MAVKGLVDTRPSCWSISCTLALILISLCAVIKLLPLNSGASLSLLLWWSLEILDVNCRVVAIALSLEFLLKLLLYPVRIDLR